MITRLSCGYISLCDFHIWQVILMEIAISASEVDSSASLGHGGLHGMLGFFREGMALEM